MYEYIIDCSFLWLIFVQCVLKFYLQFLIQFALISVYCFYISLLQKPQIKREEVGPPSVTRIAPPGSPSKPPLDPNRPPSGSKLAPLPPSGVADRPHAHRPALGLSRRLSSGANPNTSIGERSTASDTFRPSSTSSLSGAATRGSRLAPLPEGAREGTQRQLLRVDELDRDSAQQRRRPIGNQYAPRVMAERFGGSLDAQSVSGDSVDTPRRVRSGPQGIREPLLGPEDVAGEARSFSATVNLRTPRSSGYLPLHVYSIFTNKS